MVGEKTRTVAGKIVSVAALGVGVVVAINYWTNPLDLIPDVVGLIGKLDDVIALFVIARITMAVNNWLMGHKDIFKANLKEQVSSIIK